ncbi:coil containing protein [Vibrio phage 2.275.O._10N.286.54.E11]|nr:coil containing protein [Vibrio phage 2.275.O._10N.286.54.E11]
MFGLSVSSMLMLYLVNVVVVYVVLAGFMPTWLGAKINYRGKSLRLMLMALGWLPLAIGSMVYMSIRKNRDIDSMHEELEATREEAEKKDLKKQ